MPSVMYSPGARGSEVEEFSRRERAPLLALSRPEDVVFVLVA
jgi:hypothetical protein